MSIIAWVVLGAIAGVIAEKLTGSRTGIVIATAIGIVGALLGGFLAKVIFHVHSLNTFFSISTWLTAIIGAAVLVLIVRAVTGRSSHSTARP